MKEVMLRTVVTLSYQLKKSEFRPRSYEYEIRHEESLGRINVGLNSEERLLLTGKIDRLDVSEKVVMRPLYILVMKSRTLLEII